MFKLLNKLKIKVNQSQSTWNEKRGMKKKISSKCHQLVEKCKVGATLCNLLQIYQHFMCWKYFDECWMDKNLLHISLTKFNKLNKRRKHTFSIAQVKIKQNIKA